MIIPVFDCEIDAYWWVLCTEKYFKQWLTPETLKMTVAGLAMRGPALTWWLRWYPHHSWMNWDAFTSIFLWYFKPEWRVILPLPDDEEETDFEPQQWVQGDSVDEQSTILEEPINDFNQHSSSLDVANLEIATCIKDSPVQSQFAAKTSHKNEHEPLFLEQANLDDSVTFQSYELITEGRNFSTVVDTAPVVVAEQKELVTAVDNFVVPYLVSVSDLVFVTFPPPPPKPPDHILSSDSHQLMTHNSSVTIKFSTLDEKRAEANPLRRTCCPFAINASTNDVFPYDPGPLNSPSLFKVNISCYSPQSSLVNLFGNQYHIILNSKNSFSVVGFFCCETSEASKCTNIEFARQLFVKIPLTVMPTFYLNTILFQGMETIITLFQSSSLVLDCFTMSGISSDCGTLDILHCGIIDLRIAWTLLLGDYTHDVLVEDVFFRDHEFSTHAATTNKNFKYLQNFSNLEDKVGLHGVDSDISHVVSVQYLLACMIHNEGTIDDKKVVEVEIIEKSRHKTLASKIGFIAALHHIAKGLQGVLRRTRIAIKLAQGQFREILFSCDVKLADFPGSYWLNQVDKVVKCLTWKNNQFQFNFQLCWIPILLIKQMKRNKNTICLNAIISMLQGISKGVDSSKPSKLFYEVLERVHILLNFVCSAASYYLTLNSMEKEIIMFLIKAKAQCELIQIFSNYKHEVKLSLFDYLAPVVTWFKNEHNQVVWDHVYVQGIDFVLISTVPSYNLIFNWLSQAKLNDKVCEVLNDMDLCYLLSIRSYSQPEGFATFWELVTSFAIVLKQRGIARELQQICSTILRVVYFCANYHDYVNIMQQPLFLQQQPISTRSVRIGNKQLGDTSILLDTTMVQTCQFEHWDPGKIICISSNYNLALGMCKTIWYVKFKQWDPGKICVVSNFYNLEDKVDFEGVINVMILEA